MLAVGVALDSYTRNPLLRHTLRLMRTPAQAAGLSALQTFLERGFDTFRAMKGADTFLQNDRAARAGFVFCAVRRPGRPGAAPVALRTARPRTSTEAGTGPAPPP